MEFAIEFFWFLVVKALVGFLWFSDWGFDLRNLLRCSLFGVLLILRFSCDFALVGTLAL